MMLQDPIRHKAKNWFASSNIAWEQYWMKNQVFPVDVLEVNKAQDSFFF